MRITPHAARDLRLAFYALLALAAGADVVVVVAGMAHAHLALENVPLFGAAAGLLAALLIAGLAKGLGRILLTRREDYYD